MTVALWRRERIVGLSSALWRPAVIALIAGVTLYFLSVSLGFHSLPLAAGLLILSVLLGGAIPFDLKVDPE